MPHAAKEVTIVRKRIKGLSKNLEKKWFSSYSPTPDSRETQERRTSPRKQNSLKQKFQNQARYFPKGTRPTAT